MEEKMYMTKIVKFRYKEGEDFVRGMVSDRKTAKEKHFIVTISDKKKNTSDLGNTIEFWIKADQLLEKLSKLED
jgi:DNA polymerase II small subunit/DNA polymerase delta subunit B